MNCSMSPECTSVCCSQQHGSQINAAIIRGTEEQAIAYIKSLCRRCAKVTDKTGKTALHTAVSCGKKEVVEWLLAHGSSINKRDTESGYTPLHRALFYGHLHIACAIIKAGANITVQDGDSLTPLDHINLDRPSYVTFSHTIPSHLYMWGSNNNYNLGFVSQSARDTPDRLDALRREGLQIKDVALNKFHSIFLTSQGSVYACGLGNGGRLGIATRTPVIVPRLIKGFGNNKIVEVSSAIDHSLFLTESGQVWSCGINKYHQLGLTPPVEEIYVPQLLTWHKTHKNVTIKGIGAAKYHSVIWTPKTLYTFGLNGGQLGHFKNPQETSLVTPRKVTALVLKENELIKCVAVSNGATVVCTSFGDTYLLYQYQVRKIAFKMPVSKVACIGGSLDSTLNVEGITEKSDVELKIVLLAGEGSHKLHIWTEQTAELSCCLFNVKREINVFNFCLSDHMVGVVNKDGEAFIASFKSSKEHKTSRKILEKPSGRLKKFWNRSFTTLYLTRISGLHRTISIMCDPKGSNFAALQNNPKCFLVDLPQVSASTFAEDMKAFFLDTNEMDNMCDVVITCGTMNFFAHSYILACHSHYFKDMLSNSTTQNAKFSIYQSFPGEKPKKYITVPDVDPNIFQEILTYIYTGSCQILEEAKKNFMEDNRYNRNTKNEQNLSSSFENKTSQKNKKRGRKLSENLDEKTGVQSPFHTLQKLSGKFKLRHLEQEMNKILSWSNIHAKENRDSSSEFIYSRTLNQELWDVTISSSNGDKIGAHKCILSARLEYFNCMFGASWIESSASSELSMPLPTNILTTILDYLYEDDSTKLRQSREAEFVCNVLAVTDQFLMIRLREICEVVLAGLITVKNAVELLEFACTFRAKQLKNSVMEFICVNLSTIFENGALQTISDSEILADLSVYYRNLTPHLSSRILMPYDQPPYADELERLLEQNSVNMQELEKLEDESPMKETPNRSKTPSSSSKRRGQRKNSQGEMRTRKSSTSSQVSFTSTSDCDSLKDLEQEFESLDFNDLEERLPEDNTQAFPPFDKDSSQSEFTYQKNEEDMSLEELPWQNVSKKKSADNMASPQQSRSQPGPCISKNVEDLPSSGQIINEDSMAKSPLMEFPSLADSFNFSPKSSSAPRNSKMGKIANKNYKKISLGEIGQEAVVEKSSKKKPSSGTSREKLPAWGTNIDGVGVDSSANAYSLADIMKAEGNSVKEKSRKTSTPIPIQRDKTTQPMPIKRGWGTCDPSPAQRTRSDSEGSGFGSLMATSPQGNSSVISPRNSFSEIDHFSSPQQEGIAVPDFSEILKEEEVRTTKLRRQCQKTLGQIQIEDRALEELFSFYGAAECFDEKITVKRVKMGVAAANPVWSKKKSKSTEEYSLLSQYIY